MAKYAHPTLTRIWVYSTKSYSCFRDGPLNPDWLWRSRAFFSRVRDGTITAARDKDGDFIMSREQGNEVANRLRCRWFGLDLAAHGIKHRLYILVPRNRVPEVVDALGVAQTPAGAHA